MTSTMLDKLQMTITGKIKMKLGRLFKFTGVVYILVNREVYDDWHYTFNSWENNRIMRECNFTKEDRMIPLLTILFIIVLLVYSAWW